MSLSLEKTSPNALPIAIETSEPSSLVWWTPKKSQYLRKPDISKAQPMDAPRSSVSTSARARFLTGCGGCNCSRCHSGCRGDCCADHPYEQSSSDDSDGDDGKLEEWS